MATLVVAIGLVPALVAAFFLMRTARSDANSRTDAEISRQAEAQRSTFEAYFERARSSALLTAQNPSFLSFYRERGTREARVRRNGPALRAATQALGFLETLYPNSISEACFIDVGGAENARMVRGEVAPLADLSPDESTAVFFAPAFALQPGEVHQSKPYRSEDTDEWVISNATPIALNGTKVAIVHFEVSIESFRREAAKRAGDRRALVVDAKTGAPVFDSRTPQTPGTALAPAVATVGPLTGEMGTFTRDGWRFHYERLASTSTNANDWYIVTSAAAPGGLSRVVILPLLLMLALVAFLALYVARRWGGMSAALAAGVEREKAMHAETQEAEKIARADGLRRVVQEYREFAGRVASGDLTARVQTETSSELFALSTELNQMVHELAAMSADVRTASHEVHGATERIERVVSEHSVATATQAAAVDETTTASRRVRQSAERAASQARDLAQHADAAIVVSNEGGRIVGEIVGGMSSINDTVLRIANEITALSQETRAIEEITRSVNAIADQSNMLALNATIEAARAGEHGRGFAVVADEVRVLAGQSKVATSQVSEILARIEQRTAAAVEATAAGTSAAGEGMSLARDAGAAIERLAGTLRGTAEASAEIATLVQQQFGESDDIARSMNDLAVSTAQISHGVEEAMKSAGMLRTLADRLGSLTDRYQIADPVIAVDERRSTPNSV